MAAVQLPASLRLERTSTTDEIVNLLRKLIVSGELAPDTPLREAALVEKLGVSRPTLREALQALRHDGLVRYEMHRGMFVAALHPDEVVDIFQVRRVLETSAARAGGSASDPLLAKVKAALTHLEARWGGKPGPIIEADLGFHRAIVGLLASPRLAAVFDSVAAALRPCLSLLPPEDLAVLLHPESLEEHSGIAAAIAERDGERAAELIVAHSDASEAICLQVIRNA